MTSTFLSDHMARRMMGHVAGERELLLALAEGIPDLVRLGRGDPDLDTPEHIVEAAVTALRGGSTHYTHWAGLRQLRRAIAEKLRADNHVGYDPETEIIVTTGVQEGIYLACQALLNPGDEVLIGDPCYTSYADAVAFAEGRLIRVPTDEKDDFILQPDLVLEHLTPRAKVVVLVSPNNPTGAVLPEKTLEQFAQIAQERNLIVLSDEIYEKLVFDGTRHVSISSFPEMRERVVLLNGFSKSYAMTGWRVGYLAAPATFVSRCEVLKHALTISVSHVAQAAAIAALEGGDACVLKAVEVYAARRRMAMPKLSAMGLTYGYPGGTYYIFVNITSVGRTSYEFCKDILRDAKVQLFPGTVYGKGEGFVRFSLSAPLPKLQDAFSRIGECVDRYRRERISQLRL